MTDPLPRPVPRWLHVWAIVSALTTLLLLCLGQMVTSFRAGMADPVWPTEPWYLADNYKLDLGYLIEHSHRIVGFTVGLLVSVLAFGIWWGEPRKTARWIALAGLFVLLAGYGEFHRGLIAQRTVPAAQVKLPINGTVVTLVGLATVFLVGVTGLFARVNGTGLRLLAMFALVGVMIQGLLGGFRVKLNELVGTDLAAVHGIFAQVVFGLLIATAVLTARNGRREAFHTQSHSLVQWSVLLALLIFVQIAWGALVRHDPTPLTQRLHFLTAFIATAVAVGVLRAVFVDRDVRIRAGWTAWVLAGLLVVQLYLGVEAWMAKFGTYTLPELVPITVENATIRTAHALIGSGVWASALAMAIRLRRTASTPVNTLEPIDSTWSESRSHAVERAPEGVATRFRGDA